MTPKDFSTLLLLGAIWGSSFLFMRLAVPDFGALALVFVRVMGAALLLLPLVALRGQWSVMLRDWRAITIVGLLNSAVPFVLFALAASTVNAGVMAVFNATAPIWTAVIAWAWYEDKPSGVKALGLALGLSGALILAWSQIGAGLAAGAGLGKVASVAAGAATAAAAASSAGTTTGANGLLMHGLPLALGIGSCALAPVLYGVAANYTRHLSERPQGTVPALAMSAGSQLGAGIAMAVPAWLWWPTQAPSSSAWMSAAALALLCTGVAYTLFFRLMVRIGPTQATSVTFLVPGFAILWGWLALGEKPGWDAVGACALILLGTAMVTGVFTSLWPRKRAAAAQ